jgi:hypothetical protein
MITMLKEFLTQKKRPNTHLVEPDPISAIGYSKSQYFDENGYWVGKQRR